MSTDLELADRSEHHSEAKRHLDGCGVGHPWFALQVRGRQEMAVAQALGHRGYEWFVPLYKRRKRWSDRIKELQYPLFIGYLFCRFDPQWRLPVLQTPGVIRIVGYNRQPVPIDEREIAAIQSLVASGTKCEPWPYLGIGDKVRIESGPLCGLEGILLRFRGHHRLILSVTLLQRSVSVELDSAVVTSLRPSAQVRDVSSALV